MNSSSAQPPRFVPTLTEIVQADELGQPAPPVMPTADDRLESALRHIDRIIEQRVREEVGALVRSVVADQIESMKLRLHEEFEALVRAAAMPAPTEPEGPSESK